MLPNVLMGMILALLVVILVLFRGRKTENLSACPAGCVTTNPDPCPNGYKIHPSTLICVPASTIPK